VLVTVVAVDMMQLAVNHVVRVVAVRDRVMAATSAVLVGIGVLDRLFRCRERVVHGELVLDDLAFFDGVKVAVMQEVNVTFVLDFRVTTAGGMLVIVLLVRNRCSANSNRGTCDNTDNRYECTFEKLHGNPP
jgi:hypothetical protein